MKLLTFSALLAAAQAEIVAYGHRGSSGSYPENTIRAFQESVAEGASVELDLQISVDGRVVVIHDENVMRTTDGEGRVNDLEWSYMAGLDAGSWLDEEFAGERLPLLEDALEWFKGVPDRDNIKVMLDTKNVQPLIVPQIAKILSQYPELISNLLVGCWNEDCLRQCMEIIPEVPAYVISSLLPPPDSFEDYKSLNAAGFHINHRFIDDFEAARELQEAGFQLHCWTVNNVDDIENAIAMQVDAIYGDFPARIVDTIAGRTFGAAEEARDVVEWKETRESAVVGACRRLQRYGPFFSNKPSKLELFFMREPTCTVVVAVCRSTRDDSIGCRTAAQTLTATLDKFLGYTKLY